MDTEEKAERIYWHFFGSLDDKYFHANKVREIENWIIEGDAEGMGINDLIAEWGDYDAAEIKLQGEG